MGERTLQTAGGIAALVQAGAYVAAMAMGVTLLFPIFNAPPERYLEFVAGHRALVSLWNFVGYWVAAVPLVVLVLALAERVKGGAPALAQTSTAFGLIWAGLIIASGNVMLHNVRVVSELQAQDPARAVTAWTALKAMETGITSGNELVGSVWILLVSVAAFRTGALPRALCAAGAVLAVVGALTMLPSLSDRLFMAFGPGVIVWSVWIGVVLLRGEARASGELEAAR